jgi:hypothetical protein
MMIPAALLNAYLGILVSLVILPTIAATYYQAYKARQEAREAREGLLHSKNCLEFVAADGNCVNLVPLETLHSLPKPGDVVLLPGDGTVSGSKLTPGAYRIDRVEHIYTAAEFKGKKTRETRPSREARLTKAVALVTSLHG